LPAGQSAQKGLMKVLLMKQPEEHTTKEGLKMSTTSPPAQTHQQAVACKRQLKARILPPNTSRPTQYHKQTHVAISNDQQNHKPLFEPPANMANP
jgi:hypothetical protein